MHKLTPDTSGAPVRDHQQLTHTCLALLVLASLLLYQSSNPLIFTGDEPSYLFASVSIWETGSRAMSQTDWLQYLHRYELSKIEVGVGKHSFLHPLMLAPVAGEFGLQAARITTSILVALGVYCLLRTGLLLEDSRYPHMAIYTATAAMLFSFSPPLIFSASTIYPGGAIFFLVSLAIFLLSSQRWSVAKAIMITMVISFLPFIHIRAIPICVCLFLLSLRKTGRLPEIKHSHLLLLIACGVMLAVIFFSYQIGVSGSILGTASAPDYPRSDLEQLTAQLFGYRHGLLIYQPLALIGFAGLIRGTLDRNILAFTSAMCVMSYIFAILPGTASESYSLRFFTPITPFLIIGTGMWFRAVRWQVALVAATPFLIVYLWISYLSLSDPNQFLASRVHSVPHDSLRASIGVPVNLALHSFFEVLELDGAQFSPRGREYGLTAWFIFIASALFLCTARSAIRMKTGAILVVLGVSLAVKVSLVKSWESHEDERILLLNENRDPVGIVITFTKGIDLQGFRVGDIGDKPLFGLHPGERHFVLKMINGDELESCSQTASWQPLVLLECDEPVTTLVIEASDGTSWPANQTVVF